MSLWKNNFSAEDLNAFSKNTLLEQLGISIKEIGEDYVIASMPVDTRTHQPMGILHGGASVALAESVGSMAAQLAVTPGYYCVGLEINANHVRSVTTGHVHATARPLHIGGQTQVWDIRIHDDSDKLVCVSRLTMAVLKAKSA